MPIVGSSMNRKRTPTTATPSTYGVKKTARKNVRPGKARFSRSARPSGRTSRNGTDSTVKMPVASIACQKFAASRPAESNRSV